MLGTATPQDRDPRVSWARYHRRHHTYATLPLGKSARIGAAE
jgi:fatty-acid desaturase